MRATANWPSPMRLNLLERRLVDPHTTVIIPLDDRVIFVGLLNCAEFSSRLSEVAQTLDAISRESTPGRWRRARRAVVSWRGLSQGSPQRVTGVAGELYAVWVSAEARPHGLKRGVTVMFALFPLGQIVATPW